NQTRSGIKTHSTPEGEDDDPAKHFNEIRFEDKKGAEELYVQAERTMNVVVKADENRATGGDYRRTVYGETTIAVHKSMKMASNADALFGAKDSVHIVSQTDEVMLASQADEDGDPTQFIRVAPGEIELMLPGTFLWMTNDRIMLQRGPGVILIDS